MLKVLSIFGTRPEAIKLAPVIQALRAAPAEFESRVCVTGQHRQLLDPVLRLFDIRPDSDLKVMQPDQSLAELPARLLSGLAPVLAREKPDWVLIQGDTTTTLSAALAAYYQRFPVAHVEAGLRSHNPWHPYPEEFNRRLADALSTLHLAPTEGARRNLLARRRIVPVTTPRRESFGAPLRALCHAIRQLAERYPRDVEVVLPVHLNPNVQKPVREELGRAANVALLEPLDYEPLVHLMKRATLILTDSGGLQEEAPSLGVPVLVLRRVTERPEGVEAGAARVVGTDTETIVAAAVRLLENPEEHRRMAQVRNPYGDGQASRRILEALRSFPADLPPPRSP